jgi:hypothetical protein
MLCSMSVRKCIRFCIPELQSWPEVKNTNMKFMNKFTIVKHQNNTFLKKCQEYNQSQQKTWHNIQLLPALKVNIIIVHPRGVVFPEGFSPVDKCYVPCLSGNVSVFAFRNYNLDRKLKTQIWSLWKHKIKTYKLVFIAFNIIVQSLPFVWFSTSMMFASTFSLSFICLITYRRNSSRQ